MTFQEHDGRIASESEYRADTTARQRTEREFARARRSGRMVRALKIGLPVIALAIIGGGLAMTWLARALPENLSADATTIEDGRVVMEDPRMSGIDGQNRPYQLVAQRAFQSLSGGGVDLERVNAKVAIDADTNAEINAEAGHYDQKTGNLTLSNGIAVETTSGILINLSSAKINVDAGSLDGGGPVKIETPSQTIQSQSINLSDNGRKISFGGGVKMTLKPTASADLQTQASRSE